MPAADLTGQVVDLSAVLGRVAAELTERLATAPNWAACCAVLDQVLGAITTRTADRPGSEGCAQRSWRRILETGGAVQIGDLADELGYSRRQLRTLFLREYGLSPKQAARIVRFERSSELVKNQERIAHHDPAASTLTLAEIATRCGYFDQAHMTRDWNDLAGCAPSRWLDSEELPFVQDNDRDFGAGS